MSSSFLYPFRVAQRFELFGVRNNSLSIVQISFRKRNVKKGIWIELRFNLVHVMEASSNCFLRLQRHLRESWNEKCFCSGSLLYNSAISIMRLVDNSNSDSLCTRQKCCVVPKAFSMSKNTAAIEILLLKFKLTWSVSLIHWKVLHSKS